MVQAAANSMQRRFMLQVIQCVMLDRREQLVNRRFRRTSYLLDIPWQKKILSSIDIAAWAGAHISGQSQVWQKACPLIHVWYYGCPEWSTDCTVAFLLGLCWPLGEVVLFPAIINISVDEGQVTNIPSMSILALFQNVQSTEMKWSQ